MNLLKARSRFETRAHKQNEAASSSLRPQFKAERPADQVVALNILCLPSLQRALRPIMKSNPRANRASPFRYLKIFKNLSAQRNVYKTFNHKPLILSRNINFFLQFQFINWKSNTTHIFLPVYHSTKSFQWIGQWLSEVRIWTLRMLGWHMMDQVEWSKLCCCVSAALNG